LNTYELRKKNVAYVKNERSNLNIIIVIAKSTISCDALDLEENFQGTCFNHAFKKTCQHAKTNEKVCKGLKHVSIKVAQKDLQKCITWLKNKKRVDKNGTRHVSIHVLSQGTLLLQ
jgi:hypothetical protein